jgi:hypothetical protein
VFLKIYLSCVTYDVIGFKQPMVIHIQTSGFLSVALNDISFLNIFTHKKNCSHSKRRLLKLNCVIYVKTSVHCLEFSYPASKKVTFYFLKTLSLFIRSCFTRKKIIIFYFFLCILHSYILFIESSHRTKLNLQK